MRKQDWAAFGAGAVLTAAEVALLRRRFRTGARLLAVVAAGAGAARYWSRRSPEPIPASLRWVLRTPHPPAPLRRALDPHAGERVLEIGPGLGQYAVRVAKWLGPAGALDVLDVQQEMLDATMARIEARGLHNVKPTLAQAAERFPYPDGSFDAAYLTSVLGELPDPQQALSELRRVLKRAGRLVVGEVAADPDFVGLGRLRTMCEGAGLRFDTSFGPRVAFFARFVANGTSEADGGQTIAL